MPSSIGLGSGNSKRVTKSIFEQSQMSLLDGHHTESIFGGALSVARAELSPADPLADIRVHFPEL
jgi:hypothetical protein